MVPNKFRRSTDSEEVPDLVAGTTAVVAVFVVALFVAAVVVVVAVAA